MHLIKKIKSVLNLLQFSSVIFRKLIAHVLKLSV